MKEYDATLVCIYDESSVKTLTESGTGSIPMTVIHMASHQESPINISADKVRPICSANRQLCDKHQEHRKRKKNDMKNTPGIC